jgi:tRNA (cytidine56-2'-O)-methyltransferase
VSLKVIRYGHRAERDKRITTHCCLVSRAFGADEIIILGDADPKLRETIKKINSNWGGDFSLRFGRGWRKECEKLSAEGYKLVHLTMYGIPVDKVAGKIRKHKKVALFVGSRKVPPEIYSVADYNVAVTSQPHSEVSALAIFMDRFFAGKEMGRVFEGAKIKLSPRLHGKGRTI